MNVLIDNRAQILEAFARTVEIMILGGLIALVLGTVVAAMRVSPIAFARWVGAAYVNVVRNTPLLLIMFIFVFGLPELDVRPELKLGNGLLNFDVFFVFATLAIGIYTAAFVCEAIRSGINSVPVGQAEAARSIGLTFGQSLREVILPQAFRGAIAPLGSTLIALIKNTTVASVVGVGEAAKVMADMVENETASIALFAVFAIGFVILTLPLGIGFTELSRKLSVKR